ncbi:MAG: GNAT family N-acetyltransferase [Muribaculaceae bacterium]|nr:GNAT family N-acetyltransferase [Muribaculaceae bacterium]
MCTRLSIYDDCTFAKVNERFLAHCKPFSCGDSDLDDFFLNDALAYEKDLMGKTYCWVINDDITKVVGFVTLANAGIQTTHMQNNPKRHLHKNISYNKQGRTYPAVLIGRIAVAKEFQGKEYRIGTQMMDFVKDWFIAEDNKTGCRFVLVDAVNSNRTLQYYERNGFKPLFPRIEDEKDFYHINGDDLKTRMYYFDLLLLK